LLPSGGASGKLTRWHDDDAIHLGGVVRPVWLLTMLVSMGFLLAASGSETGFPKWVRLRSDLKASRERIELLRAEIEALRVEVKALESDPFALERAIREDLELARPGETVVRFVPPGDGVRARLR
jgi:cell division protein FtsB